MRYRTRLPASVNTWLDIESRFRLLAPSTTGARLDAQWGAAGEHWRIAGLFQPVARQELELLCGVAGQFLERVFSGKLPEQAALLAISDPKIRWFTLLKQANQFENFVYGEQHNEHGSSAGFIYSASLPSVAERCANLCLALQAQPPILERPSKWHWFHDNYGKAIVVGIVLAVAGAVVKLLIG